MAINYDFYKTSGALAGDKEQWHVRPTDNGTTTTDELFEYIEKATTLSRADLKAAVEALAAHMARQLSEGRRVHIEGLGHFAISMTGKITTDQNGEPHLRNAAVRDILFRPDESLKGRLAATSFSSKHHRGQHSAGISQDDIIEALPMLAAEKGFFNVAEFRRHFHLTQTTAHRHLKRLCTEGYIIREGSRNCALYRPAADKEEAQTPGES